jgi:Asp-tRNA(Asn)/Glu-tRNA(Gln) amidotransferase A subunit family amidase
MATLEQIQQALDDLHARYAKTLTALDQALEQLESAQAPVVATEVPQDELMEAARLMSMSDMNKEDLSAQDIYDMMMKTSEEEVRSKVGFWAVPLPTSDEPKPAPNKKYTTK